MRSVKTAIYLFTWRSQFHEMFRCSKEYAMKYALQRNLKYKNVTNEVQKLSQRS